MSDVFVVVNGAYADKEVQGVFDTLDGALTACAIPRDRLVSHAESGQWYTRSTRWGDDSWQIFRLTLNAPTWKPDPAETRRSVAVDMLTEAEAIDAANRNEPPTPFKQYLDTIRKLTADGEVTPSVILLPTVGGWLAEYPVDPD